MSDHPNLERWNVAWLSCGLSRSSFLRVFAAGAGAPALTPCGGKAPSQSWPSLGWARARIARARCHILLIVKLLGRPCFDLLDV